MDMFRPGAGETPISFTEALTFDDVLLVPGYSEVIPRDIDTGSKLAAGIHLNSPFMSAAMDTVTEADMAIALARFGGIGVVHKNMTPTEQAGEVERVKRSESGMITSPITMGPDESVDAALAVMARFRISGVPITENDRLVGILTNRDLRFLQDTGCCIREVMTSENLVTVPVGTTLDEARNILHRHRIEKVLVVNEAGDLRGLITVKDIQKKIDYPNACKDEAGRLRVAAAVGVGGDTNERVRQLMKVGVDLLVVDTAHGHSRNVIEGVAAIRRAYPESRILAGNIATGEAATALIDAGANAVKVGIGPGSICTTRVVAGVGVPQISAIIEVATVTRARGISLVADGGIRYSGDVAKAIAVGADVVMVGSLLAGTEESPGEKILYEGRVYKSYRGMGSLGAMRKGSKDRYFQSDVEDDDKLVPEGIEGRVSYKGRAHEVLYQLDGGLRSGMGYCGCADLDCFQKNSRLVRITAAGMRESHPHGVHITKEAPNYGTGK